MKHVKKVLYIFILSIAVVFFSCSDNSGVVVNSVRVDSLSLDFLVGQSLSLKDATILATTSIGEKIVSPDDVVFNSHTFSASEIGTTQSFSASYLGIPFTFNVNVYDVESVKGEIIGSSKTYYQYASERGVYDNSFDKNTCRVTATYNNGKTKILNNEDYDVISFEDSETSVSGNLTLRTKVGTNPYSCNLTVPITADKATGINVETDTPVEHTPYYPDDISKRPIRVTSIIRESGFVDTKVDQNNLTIISKDFYIEAEGGGFKYCASDQYPVYVTYSDSESGASINDTVMLTIIPASSGEGV